MPSVRADSGGTALSPRRQYGISGPRGAPPLMQAHCGVAGRMEGLGLCRPPVPIRAERRFRHDANMESAARAARRHLSEDGEILVAVAVSEGIDEVVAHDARHG
ncbi:hypothetical protein AWB70_07312 [Caballeronia cordobensis]|uniref:Uncharacterized protein n=1 Tax=Caballeronia cordobensis TaxID=1353886 RepID=A0A158JS00_CABCO|nr:hypothetical protein AWB70_07312 [Caballeronia cordobensis]